MMIRKSLTRPWALVMLLGLTLTAPACMYTDATTNATTDATGGITNATSDATHGTTNLTSPADLARDGIIRAEYRRQVFAAVNFDSLRQDMAAGRGESLASLRELLGVSPERQAEFFALTQQEYGTLFPVADTKPRDMLATLDRLMTAHPALD